MNEHFADAGKPMTPELLAVARELDAYAGSCGDANAWQGVGMVSVPIRLLVNLRIALKELP